jgi:hypothetical protein
MRFRPQSAGRARGAGGGTDLLARQALDLAVRPGHTDDGTGTKTGVKGSPLSASMAHRSSKLAARNGSSFRPKQLFS